MIEKPFHEAARDLREEVLKASRLSRRRMLLARKISRIKKASRSARRRFYTGFRRSRESKK